MSKPEAYYNEHAKSGCHECKGKGMLLDYHSQDNATLEPCSTCFPDDPDVIKLRDAKSKYAYLNSRSGTVVVPVP